MREKKIDPGHTISELLGDINAWKNEDILPEEHKKMLTNAEEILHEAEKYHKRYLTSNATMEAKQRRKSPNNMVMRYRREAQNHSYQRDTEISKAQDILADIIAQIEKLAEGF